MKKLLIGLLMFVSISAQSAIVTYNYIGPDAQAMISGELLYFENCDSGCFGEVEIYFIPENYVTVTKPFEIYILLEALQESSLEFIVTTKQGSHYALSPNRGKNILKVDSFFADYIKLHEISSNYLK
jgi:hypothetical protein